MLFNQRDYTVELKGELQSKNLKPLLTYHLSFSTSHQSVGPTLAAWASLRSLFEMQDLWPNLRFIKSVF